MTASITPRIAPRRTPRRTFARPTSARRVPPEVQHRLTPREAADRVERGAVLIDLRSDVRRRRQGDVAGAQRIASLDRLNHLDLTPGTDPSDDDVVVLLSATGETSAVVAARLRSQGKQVLDVAGGVAAWEADGLPVYAYRHGDIGHHERR